MQFSARSQSSFLREQALNEEIGRAEDQSRYSERKLSELEAAKARLSESVLAGSASLQGTLALALREIEDERRKLELFEEHIGGLRKKIDQMRESDTASPQKRLERQKALAMLTIARLESDRLIDESLAELRNLLRQRSEMTRKMQEAGGEIELSADWDAEGYGKLLEALPESLLPASERWSAKFLGKPEGASIYVVRVDRLLLPETLAHSGVYFFGETVQLFGDEARELLREDIPAPRSNAVWGCEPAKIMLQENFREAEKAAEKVGISVREILLWRDVENNKRAKARFHARPWSTAGLARDVHTEQALNARVKARGSIHKDGREYKPGEILTVENMRQFWQLADAGAIALPA